MSAPVSRGERHGDPGGAHGSDDSLEDVGIRAALAGGAHPGVVDDVGAEVRAGVLAAGVRRRQEPLEALRVARGRPRAARHVAAPDEARAGGDADRDARRLADGEARDAGAVPVVVAGRRRVRAAGVAGGGVVDGVVPVVVVDGGRAVPTAVVRLESRMLPLEPRIGDADDDPLSRDPLRPERGGTDPLDVGLDRLDRFDRLDGLGRPERPDERRRRPRPVGGDSRDVVARGQNRRDLRIRLDLEHVDQKVRAEGNPACGERAPERRLRPFRERPEGLVDEPAALDAVGDAGGAGQIRLLAQDDEDRGARIRPQTRVETRGGAPGLGRRPGREEERQREEQGRHREPECGASVASRPTLRCSSWS